MKITLPEHVGEITLDKWQRLKKISLSFEEGNITVKEFQKKKIALLSGIPYHQIDNVSHKDTVEVLEQIDLALTVVTPFVHRFKLNGIEFGFIPNFDKIANSEYFDLNLYGVEDDTLHNLMAVLFRPIVKKSGTDYDIETYKGTEKYSELMKQMPMNIVDGAKVFFWNLSKELRNHILKSTGAELRKEGKRSTTSLNGAGTVPSMN